ncbi:MAG: phosphoglucosamine mutase [Aeropyrum sp.]|nr:phosphoglucosamine mutase [Aeropyrum sp.]
MGKLFGTDGVRGVIGREFTPELVLRLARAIGSYFGRGSRILVGRDTRSAGYYYEGLVVAGLAFEGVKVDVAGVLPTPALQLYVRDKGYDAGVMITASHNPPEYNGVKVVGGDGIEISGEVEEEIEKIFFEERFSSVEWQQLSGTPGRVTNAIDYYVESIARLVDSDRIKARSYKVLVDCGGGATSYTTPKILSRLGVKPVTLNCNPDPLFPARSPEPSPKSLTLAARTVVESGAVLGVGHDADGDRAIVIDDLGRIHWGDRSGTLLAAHVVEAGIAEGPKRVFTGVSSSSLVEEYLRQYGVEVVWTPVGAPKIAKMLREMGGIAAFEENGGYMHPPHQLVRDGGMKIALMLSMLSEDGGLRSSVLFNRLPKYYPIKIKIPSSREDSTCALAAVEELFAGERLVKIDGVKVIGEDYWVLVRPSGTEPVLRIMLEAKSEGGARKLLEKVLEAIASRCPSLSRSARGILS